MALPVQTELEVRLLRLIDEMGGEARPKDLYGPLASQFQLTEEDRRERMESTGANKWENDVQWVRQRLVQRGDLDGSVRGLWRITDAGRARARGTSPGPQPVRSTQDVVPASSIGSGVRVLASQDRSPAEQIEIADRQLRQALASDVLREVRRCTPAFFERVVIDLLVAMGYGGSRLDAGRPVGRSGDGGLTKLLRKTVSVWMPSTCRQSGGRAASADQLCRRSQGVLKVIVRGRGSSSPHLSSRTRHAIT